MPKATTKLTLLRAGMKRKLRYICSHREEEVPKKAGAPRRMRAPFKRLATEGFLNNSASLKPMVGTHKQTVTVCVNLINPFQ